MGTSVGAGREVFYNAEIKGLERGGFEVSEGSERFFELKERRPYISE